MGKMRRSGKADDQTADEPSFEQSLEKLGEIVQALEEGQLGLSEAMQQHEEGVALLRRCYQVLEQAERRIELVTGTDDGGTPEVEPFDDEATVDRVQRDEQRRPKARRKKASGRAKPSRDNVDGPEELF